MKRFFVKNKFYIFMFFYVVFLLIYVHFLVNWMYFFAEKYNMN